MTRITMRAAAHGSCIKRQPKIPSELSGVIMTSA